MTVNPADARGWYNIKGTPAPEAIRTLGAIPHIKKLSITDVRLLTVDLAKHFRSLQSVEWMWLWCDVTRAAMRHIVRIPGLKVLDVLNMKAPGSLEGFEVATTLHTVRANHYLREQDVLAITQCATLQELSIQSAELTPKVLTALQSLKELRVLDVEGTAFDDSMAVALSDSETLEALDMGATKVSRVGLQALTSMRQLRSLDLWATKITEADLELLGNLPKLEYLSVGNYEEMPSLDAAKLVPLLLSLPSLKRVWLDGVTITDRQSSELQARLQSVRIT